MTTRHEQPTALRNSVAHVLSPAKLLIRAYDSAADSLWLRELWKKAMATRWAMTDVALQEVVTTAKLVLVAEQDGLPVGIGAVNSDPLGEAALVFLIVDPEWQRHGIGTFILGALDNQLRSAQIRLLRLGAVTTAVYLWPGLPGEMEAAWPFFAQRGWHLEEGCDDLVQELGSFHTPSWLATDLRTAGVSLGLCSPALRGRVAAFEAAHFPAWASYFHQDDPSADGDDRILVAMDSDGKVVGTLLLDADIPQRWSLDRDVRVGSLNALGVATQLRRQGIGLALAARAMELLQERGCTKCYIQWTGLAGWYGRLGARVWARYRMATKHL